MHVVGFIKAARQEEAEALVACPAADTEPELPWCCPGRLLRVIFRSGGTLVVAFKVRCSLQSDLEARLARLKSSENIVPLRVPKELEF